jgi:hypothetical protein
MTKKSSYRCSCDVARSNFKNDCSSNVIIAAFVHSNVIIVAFASPPCQTQVCSDCSQTDLNHAFLPCVLTQDEHNCVHEEAVHSALNVSLTSEEGPVRVSDLHFGASVVPLYEYEDKTWSGSGMNETQGRSAAHVHLRIDTMTREICFVKVDTHIKLTVRCRGGNHFNGSCCVEVRDCWNARYSDNLAQLVSGHSRPVFVDAEAGIENPGQKWWPPDDSKNNVIAQLCKPWKDRGPQGECGRVVLFLFFISCLQLSVVKSFLGLPHAYAGVLYDDMGRIQLRPALPKDDGSWSHELVGEVTVYDEYSACRNVQVFRSICNSGDTEPVSFSFSDIGLFATNPKGKATAYCDVQIFYDSVYKHTVSNMSIESSWERLVHQYSCWQECHSDTPNLLPFVAKKVFYEAYHRFVRSLVGALAVGVVDDGHLHA